jgi:myo-inositol catabolism protein IolC
MKPSALEIIVKESGCDSETVRRIATLVLRELHRIAATDENVTTGAIMETYWSFGTEACYHVGGLLMYHDDGTNRPGHQTESLVPETMHRFIGGDAELPEIRDRWLSFLAADKAGEE